MWGKSPTCALLLQVVALCAVGGWDYMLVAIQEAAMYRVQVEYEPSMHLCISSSTWIETEQMQTIHWAIKRKSLNLRRATHGKTNSLSGLVQPWMLAKTQCLTEKESAGSKREIHKIRGNWLSALRAAPGYNCPDQLHLTLHPQLQPISTGAHLSSSLKVQPWIELF